MLRNYFKAAYRHLLRHKFFSVINIFGLSLGFGCTLLLMLFVWQETHYDSFHKNADRIVRVVMKYKVEDNIDVTAYTGAKVAPTFTSELPEVEKAVRIYSYPVVVSTNEKIFDESAFLYADSTFFDVFSFTLLAGNPYTALKGPSKVLLTPQTAKRYFGVEDPIGKTLKLNNTREYEVTGIIEAAPENSQIRYDFVASFASLGAYENPQWFNANYFTYLLLHSEDQINHLQDKLFAFMQTKSAETGMSGNNYLTYQLEPLKEVHLYSSSAGLESNMDVRYVYIFGVVALLILLIACINYINLSTARAFDRGTEVGIRKVMGAFKKQLFWQYICESMISVLLAAVLGGVVALLALPYFNDAIGKSYSLEVFSSPPALFIIFLIIVLCGLGSGAYPALILTRFSPSKTLKGKFQSSSSGQLLRRGLIVFQFAISAVLIICSLVIYRQLNFIRTIDLGYTRDLVFTQKIGGEARDHFPTIKNQFMQYAQVDQITLANTDPTEILWGDGITMLDGREIMVNANPVESNFLSVFDIELLAGKDFSIRDQDQAESDSVEVLNQKGRSIIINKQAAQLMGWTPDEAIGKRVEFKGNATIIGVTDDFHYTSLHEEVGALVLFVDEFYNQLIVLLHPGDVYSTMNQLGTEWKKLVPDRPFNPVFLDEAYNSMYYNEQRLGELFSFFTTLAVGLGFMGLLGLSALMISHRTKEIGIRKVLGASVPRIIRELSRDFILLVLIGFVIAVPLAWYVMDRWLQTFIYRINMPWAIFLLAGGALLFCALLVLSTQTVKAALRNPADVIRNE